MSSRLTRGIGVFGAFALVAACSKGENKADSAALADSAAKAGAMATGAGAGAAAAPAPVAMTDANIFAFMDEANAADSTGGSKAATMGKSGDVKAYGREMMKDHHKLRADGQALAKKLNVTPAPASNDSLPAMAQRMDASLSAAGKGAAWDKAYIDGEVATHQYVQSMLQTAQGAAQDTSLKAAITKALPMIQAHLTKAQSIQSKLGGASGTGAAGSASGAGMTGAGTTTGTAGSTAGKKKP